MKRLWAQILVSLTCALGQNIPQYESFLGCYQDDKTRDLKTWKTDLQKGKMGKNTLTKCREWAKTKNKTYFSMQYGTSCAIANSFGKGKYVQLPTGKCTRSGYTCGNSEHIQYCGGAWANALYSTKPKGPPLMVKANKWMQINSPWKRNFCLYTSKGGKYVVDVRMKECTYRGGGATEKNYLWQWDNKGRFINARWKGKCLDAHLHDKNIFLSNCHNGNNQKWYFNFGDQLISKHLSWAMDWHTGNNNIYAGKWHTGENMKFWWNTGHGIQVKGGTRNGRVWVSTTKNGRKVDLGKFNGDNQKWKIIEGNGKGWYYIKLSGGVIEGRNDLRLDNVYLSVTKNGKKIDLIGKDDASGRQRWKIKKLRDGYFNIMVFGGVEGGGKYLSCGINGDYVDLWKKDDKSGRQRWKLFDSSFTPKPTPRPTPRPTPVPVRNLVSGGGWKIVKGKKDSLRCTISIENGVKYPCAVSPNYPKTYNREESCTISMSKKTEYVALEGSTEKYFDYLTLAGKEYSGKLKGQKVKVKGRATAKWTADFWQGTKGWKFCKVQPPRLKLIGKRKKGKKQKKKDKRKNKKNKLFIGKKRKGKKQKKKDKRKNKKKR